MKNKNALNSPQPYPRRKAGGGCVERLVGPSDRTIRRRLKELRALIDTSEDPAERRIAYGMERSIRWARQETVGWEAPVVTARDLTKMLHDEWPNVAGERLPAKNI